MTRARADAHELDADVRSQASTLPNALFIQICTISGFPLPTVARRPTAEGPTRQNLVNERLCSSIKKRTHIATRNIIK